MERFNLSRWGLQRPQLMAFLILVVACAGAFAYARLGRAEDPSFTIKNAVVTALASVTPSGITFALWTMLSRKRTAPMVVGSL